MKFLKIKETCLYIHDLEGARRFYQDILNLIEISYVPTKHLFLKAGESVLLLFNPEDSKHKKSPPGHYGGGKQHFAFEVESKDYLPTKQEIILKGITIIDEVTWTAGIQSFYFNDPEGNVLEVLPNVGVWPN
jgi:catechol-2,3-dioxygenase